VSITTAALQRGFAVIAMSSSNRVHKCWTQEDILPVIHALKLFYRSNPNFLHLKETPLYLLGASSGGAYVGSLAQIIPEDAEAPRVVAICVQISGIAFHSNNLKNVPPTYFLHMSKDVELSHRVEGVMSVMKTHAIDAVAHDCREKVVDVAFLHSLRYFGGGGDDDGDKVKLISALKQGGVLSSNGKLIRDPRSSEWRQVLRYH
jgi:hypothetical protein